MGKPLIPFIDNMKRPEGIEPVVEKITENGKYDTMNVSKIKVSVEGAPGELTPEKQDEILNEEY